MKEKEIIRPEREYAVHYRDDQCGDSETFSVPVGTETDQDKAAWAEAAERAGDWIRGGDWGIDGAVVCVRYHIEDAEWAWEDRSIEVTIEPDHDALIRAAGGATACAHEWTRDGEGGCAENPGVWSLGGTAIVTREHCRSCGLVRVTVAHGSQRNPGQTDTVEYEVPI